MEVERGSKCAIEMTRSLVELMDVNFEMWAWKMTRQETRERHVMAHNVDTREAHVLQRLLPGKASSQTAKEAKPVWWCLPQAPRGSFWVW